MSGYFCFCFLGGDPLGPWYADRDCCAPHVVDVPAAVALTRSWPTTRRSELKCEEIGLKYLCNRWCLCFTTTERLAARLISSGFGLWCRGEREGSLAWPISPCQDGHKNSGSSEHFHQSLLQGSLPGCLLLNCLVQQDNACANAL